MVAKKEKTDTENKCEIFQRGYAEANILLSRQVQVKNGNKLWTDVKNDFFSRG